MKHPLVALSHLDHLWFQVTGTQCNLACTHCFNNSGPNVRTFGFLTIEHVREELKSAARVGAKEVFFTGGEPFLHPQLAEMLELSLGQAPTSVLTNGTLLNERMAERLGAIERGSRYSLEIRVSLDSFEETSNDAIRGQGVFRQATEAVARLSRRGLLPIVTVVRTWKEEDDPGMLRGFHHVLEQAGYSRPRIKILPALPLGRELIRAGSLHQEPLVTEEMMRGFDLDLLMCSNSRMVTDRGVWVCPLLVEMPDARLGDTLEDATGSFFLRHRACYSCYHYGTICGNINVQIEGPTKPIAAEGGRTA